MKQQRIHHYATGMHAVCLDGAGMCPVAYTGEVGYSVYHSHTAALSAAKFLNKRAGRKIKRVEVFEGHFAVVCVDDCDHRFCQEVFVNKNKGWNICATV